MTKRIKKPKPKRKAKPKYLEDPAVSRYLDLVAKLIAERIAKKEGR